MPTRSDSLRLVATGLRLVYFGFCLSILSGFALGIMLAAKVDPRTSLLLGFGGIILGYALDIAGRLCCLAMPADATTALPLILISVIFTLIGLVISAALVVGLLGMPDLLPSETIRNLSTPVAGLGSLLFLFFLRQVALYVGSQKLADRVWSILILGIILIGAYAGIYLMTQNAERAGDMASVGLLGLVVLVLALVLLILYGNLLTYLSTDVRKFADRQPDEFEDEDMQD